MKNNIPNMKALHFAPILLSFWVLILLISKLVLKGTNFVLMDLRKVSSKDYKLSSTTLCVGFHCVASDKQDSPDLV